MRTRTTALGIAGLLAAGLLTALPTATTQASAPVARAAIDWGRCADPALRRAQARCGLLEVPLDHADPDGPTIEIAVSRVLHTAEPYRGAVFTNPGGPGGSGTYLATLGGSVPGKVGRTYDWYGVDVRGVGDSRPALSCDRGYSSWDRPAYVPERTRDLKSWRAKTARYAEDCGTAKAAELLEHVRTVDNVADFEALREAIGAEQVTFYGFSYGTYIAQVYATLHPDRLEAVVMDGVVDPRRVFYRSNLDQNRAFDRAFHQFLRWIAKHPRELGLGRTEQAVHRRYQALHDRLGREPAANGRIGPSELDDAMLAAAYNVRNYPYVAQSLAGLANRGWAAGIRWLYGGPGDDNGHAMYLATECTDAPWPTAWATWERDMWRSHRNAPFMAWPNAWFNAPCRTWPVPAGERVDVDGAELTAPVLLLSETHDPATPFAGALAARRTFPTSALVEGVGGWTHSSSLSGVACTDRTVAAFLRDGSLPARKPGDRSDKECAPLPVPPLTTNQRVAPPRPWIR